MLLLLQFGDSGGIYYNPGSVLPQDIYSIEAGIGGDDTLSLGDGDNVGVGGSFDDTIDGGNDHDIIVSEKYCQCW